MTLKEFERWGRMRKGGKKSFIWMQGVLGFGVVMALCMAVVISVLNMLLEETSFNPYFLIRQLVINLLIFPVIGYAWGAWTWSYTERNYLREQNKFPGTLAGE